MSVEEELRDTSTSAERLREIAALSPDYAAQIASHPQVYPELRDWCLALAEQPVESQANINTIGRATPTQKRPLKASSVIAMSVGALLLLSIAGGATAFALNAQRAKPAEEATLPAAPSTAPRATAVEPLEEVTETQEIWLDSERHWLVHGEVIVTTLTGDSRSKNGLTYIVPGNDAVDVSLDEAFAVDDNFTDFLDWSWETVGGEDPGVVLYGVFREPAVGLTPETYRIDTVWFDSNGQKTGSAEALTQLDREPELDGGTGSAEGVIALTARIGDNPITLGISLDGEIWRVDGRIVEDSYGVAMVNRVSTQDGRVCSTLTAVSVESGNTVWSFDPAEVGADPCHQYRAKILGQIDIAKEPVIPRNSIVEISRVDSAFMHWRSLNTGEMLPVEAIGEQVVDDDATLAWIRDYFHQGPARVYDLRTGDVVFDMDRDEADRLELEPLRLHSGYLYATTTDGQPVIRLSDGEVVNEHWERYPFAQLGDWWYFSDGLLTNTPYDPESGL